MAFTRLSLTATPGRNYSSAAKKGSGRFTELSNSALPGRTHSFVPKISAGEHTGLFTALQVYALPGKRHTFIAKEEAITGKSKTFEEPIDRWRILREDEEILPILIAISNEI